MKTAVSLPDDVFAEAEALARRLAKTRSQLYREAIAEYVARHDPDAVTAALDRVAAGVAPDCDRFPAAAARRLLERSEW